jgi:hypothetical protein
MPIDNIRLKNITIRAHEDAEFHNVTNNVSQENVKVTLE